MELRKFVQERWIIPINIVKDNQIPIDQLREHYLIERELSDRLRNATKDERRYLYSTLYDEFYRRLHDYPSIIQKKCYGQR